MSTEHRLDIRVTGRVQGVGFRPYVWKRATALGLTGCVYNSAEGVTIEVQGDPEKTALFLQDFIAEAPPLAEIDSVKVHPHHLSDLGALPHETQFVIQSSYVSGARSAALPPDMAPCDECLREMRDPADRRFRYPFINCTHCGPRFTIIEGIPYDRPLTTMNAFVMCEVCQREYNDPADRRFHAQPNACPECGPRVWFAASAAEVSESPPDGGRTDEALAAFAAATRAGETVAVKGIGGFHLACDVANPAAVERLRQRKRRGAKPLAVMVRSVADARRLAIVSDVEQRLLESQERPIVLLPKRADSEDHAVLDAVAPDNNFIGVVLPYSPLHALLLEECSPLVMTSGNASDEPIARTNDEAAARLAGLADRFLLHDRPIYSVCDDSVVRRVGQRLLPIRRSRGYTPTPISLADDGPSVLAVGAELKAAFCLAKGRHAYPSQHIGDVGNLETVEALRRGVRHWLKLYRVKLDAVAGDRHPDYLSTRWAQELAAEAGVPFLGVQHHEAHAASLVAEARWDPERPLLVACFDGTGLGRDGKIWGGEFMLVRGGSIERVGCLRNFPLPGGDAGVRRPYRAALSLLRQSGVDWNAELPCVAACGESERQILATQIERGLNCVDTSSMGRLFDAVAALIGVRQTVDYEAQAAMEMEALAASAIDRAGDCPYAFDLGEDGVLDPGPVVVGLCEERRTGAPRDLLAARFHLAVADAVAAFAARLRVTHGVEAVGLSGGVFQNALLTELVEQRCGDAGFTVVTHSTVPPNDGGLALGQVVIARAMLQRERC